MGMIGKQYSSGEPVDRRYIIGVQQAWWVDTGEQGAESLRRERTFNVAARTVSLTPVSDLSDAVKSRHLCLDLGSRFGPSQPLVAGPFYCRRPMAAWLSGVGRQVGTGPRIGLAHLQHKYWRPLAH